MQQTPLAFGIAESNQTEENCLRLGHPTEDKVYGKVTVSALRLALGFTSLQVGETSSTGTSFGKIEISGLEGDLLQVLFTSKEAQVKPIEVVLSKKSAELMKSNLEHLDRIQWKMKPGTAFLIHQ